MTNLARLLLGTAIVTGVGAVAAIVTDKKEEKKTEKVVDIAEAAVSKDEKLLDKIKRWMKKKFVKFVIFSIEHMQEIEAVSMAVGLLSGVISVAGAVRDYKKGNDTQEKLDSIEAKIDKIQHDQHYAYEAMTYNNTVDYENLNILTNHIDDKIDTAVKEIKTA